MADKTIPVRLPAELLEFLDKIRFSETAKLGRQWTSIPASQSETVEKILWEAYARVQRNQRQVGPETT